MALSLVFIGRDEDQTRRYFREFIDTNREQVQDFTIIGSGAMDWIYPRAVRLKDGTQIRKAPNSLDMLDGLHIDQVIVACSRRGVWNWPEPRLAMLQELIRRAACSDHILEQDRVIIYELDAREGDRNG